MTDLRISLLGAPEISRGGESVTHHLGHKALGLLAYLALSPSQGYRREELAGEFWGKSDNEHASYNLRRCLWSLRKVINPPAARSDTYVSYSEGRYSFDHSSDHWIDAIVFEQAVTAICRRHIAAAPHLSAGSRLLTTAELSGLRIAVQLYRGDFLEGYSLPGGADFSDWLFLERDRLQQLYMRGLRALAVENAIRGRYRQAIVDFQQILSVDPVNEATNCDLMAAYHMLGERDKAMEQYHTLCRALRELLDLEPLSETRTLYSKIRDATFSAEGPDYWLVSAEKTGVPALPSGSPFIGREREQIILGDALESTARGHGCLAVVKGEGGVGKTRLIEEFLYHASGAPLIILRARCYAQEQGSPYQPIIDALRDHLPIADSRHTSSLDSLWLTEVARLLPELRSYLPSLPASPALLADHERNRLFEGLAQFIRHMGELQPLVLFLDDFHTADEPTFDLVHYLVRRLEAARVLVIVALQQEALPERRALQRLLYEFDRLGRVIAIPLARLSEMEVLELVRRTLPKEIQAEEIGHRLFLETGGNSFFLVEMLRDCQEWQGAPSGESSVPPTAMDVIQRRLNRLDDEEIRALSMAAVIGRQFNSTILQEVYSGGEMSLLIILDRLLSRGWIVELPGGVLGVYEFSHGLVREAVYQTLRADWRRYLHLRVGLALERNASDLEGLAGQLAHHFWNANDVNKALDYTIRAAVHARSIYGNREAIGHYRRAMEFVDQTDAVLSAGDLLEIQYQLGQAHQFLGEYDMAIAVYRDVLPALDLSRSRDRRIRFQLAIAHDRKGQYDQALSHLRVIGRCLPEPDDPLARLESAMVARGVAMVYLHREQSHQALAYCRQALALVDSSHGVHQESAQANRLIAERVSVYDIMANSLFHLGDYGAAEKQYREALEIAQSKDWQPTVSELLLGLAKVARRRGHYAQATSYGHKSLDLCLKIGHIGGQAASLGVLGDIAYNRGDLEQAIAYYEQALTTFRQIGDQHGIADYLLSLAFVMIDQEQIQAAENYLCEAQEIGQSIGATLVLIRAQYHLARVARARGDLDKARIGADQVIEAAERAGIRLLEAMGYHLLGEVLARQRHQAQAEVHMVEALRLLERLGDRFETACALRSHARLLADRGDSSHAKAQLERAAATFAELGARRELARTHADLARLFRGQK